MKRVHDIDLLAVKTIAGTSMFVLTSLACIWTIVRNVDVAEGLTIFASAFFAMILAILGVNGWQSIQKRKTEWEPSQEVKDQIQLARMLKPGDSTPKVTPFVPVGPDAAESVAVAPDATAVPAPDA